MPFTIPRLFTLDLADKLHHAKGESSEKSKWLLSTFHAPPLPPTLARRLFRSVRVAYWLFVALR